MRRGSQKAPVRTWRGCRAYEQIIIPRGCSLDFYLPSTIVPLLLQKKWIDQLLNLDASIGVCVCLYSFSTAWKPREPLKYVLATVTGPRRRSLQMTNCYYPLQTPAFTLYGLYYWLLLAIIGYPERGDLFDRMEKILAAFFHRSALILIVERGQLKFPVWLFFVYDLCHGDSAPTLN